MNRTEQHVGTGKYAVGLFIVLALLWAMLSGMPKALIIGLGVVSCALVTWIAVRMNNEDGYHAPLLPGLFGLIGYTLWLTKEIVVANLQVAKLVIAPKLSLHPAMITVDASELTELGQVIYANSITLTPGTVSLFIRDGRITVHSLIDDAADGLQEGAMLEKVKTLGPSVIRDRGDESN